MNGIHHHLRAFNNGRDWVGPVETILAHDPNNRKRVLDLGKVDSITIFSKLMVCWVILQAQAQVYGKNSGL
jgi:hypothetical protein